VVYPLVALGGTALVVAAAVLCQALQPVALRWVAQTGWLTGVRMGSAPGGSLIR
jgi:hypothetical protein